MRASPWAAGSASSRGRSAATSTTTTSRRRSSGASPAPEPMTALPLQRIGYEDRLTLTGHLEELRARLVVCAATLAVLFGVCMWQSPALLRVLDRPLASVPASVSGTLQSPLRSALTRSARAFSTLARSD